MRKVLTEHQKRSKMLTVRDGYLVCPVCRRNRHLLRVLPNTNAQNVALWCRDCKHETVVNIVNSQCFESRS